MRPTDDINQLIKKMELKASTNLDKRVHDKISRVQVEPERLKPTYSQPDIWRILLRSRMSKLTAAGVIIVAALLLMPFFDRGTTTAYALEQTIEANHAIKTIHLRFVEGGQNIENNEYSDCRIKYDDAGLVSNFRCDVYEDGENRAHAVWNEGILKIWRPLQNVVIIIRVNDMEKYWEHFAKEYDPKLIFQWLYVSRGNEANQLHIDEPAKDSNSIYVKAINSIDKTRLELVIDPKTKLVKELSRYRLGEQKDELETRIEVLAYNQSIDPSMFELSNIPDDVLVIDQIDQLVGLEQGDLTNNEIAVKVVRETLDAAIAKDYEKVSSLMEGAPGNTIEGFVEEEFKAGLVRVISIGQPELHEMSGYHIYVPCEIEVENKERGKWTVNIVAMTEFISYQAGRRWVVHCPDKDDRSHISTNSTIDAQDRIGEKLIVPGERVGDFRLGINKDEVLRKLGKPKMIFLGEERYTLNNLPRRYFIVFSDISFSIDGDSVIEITAHSPLYVFSNGLKVGDSEQSVIEALGDDFQLKETQWKDFLIYEDKGLTFEIHKKNRTVTEITVDQPERRQNGNYKPEVYDGELRAYEDISGKDLSACDLCDAADILNTLEFNQETLWPPPERLPEGFDPQVLLKEGMNPGLGVWDLHAQGITGAGIHVGLIDQPLLLDHPEYPGKIVSYHSYCGPHQSSMHGPAMASQLVGKRCGTAPGAKLHVLAVPSWEGDAGYYARALDRFVAYNKNAPEEEKICVVSVSAQPSGEGSGYKNQPLWDEAVQRAQTKGILVLDCTWNYGFVSLC